MQKTALVSGASGGIGAAITERLAKEGFAVAALYHQNAAGAEALVQEITAAGGTAAAFGCDIRDSRAVANAVDAVHEKFGSIDVLVGSAGVARQKLFQDITDEEWDEMRGVHLDGAFYLTRAVLPDMLHKKCGRIIHIASMWGETGGSCEVDYSAVKAGLIGMVKALAKELAPSGITVNCVSPGAVDTPMLRALGDETCAMLTEEIPLGRLGTPEDIAGAVAFLASDDAAYITGQVLSVNGGLVI